MLESVHAAASALQTCGLAFAYSLLRIAQHSA